MHRELDYDPLRKAAAQRELDKCNAFALRAKHDYLDAKVGRDSARAGLSPILLTRGLSRRPKAELAKHPPAPANSELLAQMAAASGGHGALDRVEDAETREARDAAKACFDDKHRE